MILMINYFHSLHKQYKQIWHFKQRPFIGNWCEWWRDFAQNVDSYCIVQLWVELLLVFDLMWYNVFLYSRQLLWVIQELRPFILVMLRLVRVSILMWSFNSLSTLKSPFSLHRKTESLSPSSFVWEYHPVVQWSTFVGKLFHFRTQV